MPRSYPFGDADRLTPHPLYATLRDEEPLCRVRLPHGSEAWLVTQYDDVRKVLTDPRFSRAEAVRNNEPRTYPERRDMGMLDMDPPRHTRIRRLVATAFSAHGIEKLRPRAQVIADDLVDRMLSRGGPVDLVDHYARPMPATVIGEMFGVPVRDRPRFGVWMEALTSTDRLSPQQIHEYFDLLWAYLGELVAQRRRAPADDLLSALVAACAQDKLSEDEIAQIGAGQLAASYDTTASHIANFTYALFSHPAQLDLLRTSPGMVGQAVEELLRFTPLVTSTMSARYATKDIELSGGVVRTGEFVLPSTVAANRDARRFPDPDRLDLTRTDNPHLALGHGLHRCLGHQAARMMLQVAVGTLVGRVPGLRLAVRDEDLVWKTHAMVRGTRTLPVTW